MNPIPAILVTGAAGAGKTAFIRALAAACPSGERWAVLDNDNSDLARALAGTPADVAAISGCLCCTGQVALQTGIVKLLRHSRPQRLIIAASGAAEPAALQHALRQEHVARAMQVTHHLCVAASAQLTAYPSAAGELWLQQLRAADFAIAADGPAADALRAALTTLGLAEKRVVPTADAALSILSPKAATGAAVA